MSGPKLTVKNFVGLFNGVVDSFRDYEVLVGIPEESPERKAENKDQINNATLLAINNFGSPANNIPARPVMAIGIKESKEQVGEQFKQAAIAAFSQGTAGIWRHYERAGIIAANSIKKVINSQEGIDGPSENTLAARARRGFKGTKSLVVTGQMRNAITSLVRGRRRG